jgi:hypothetical protein
MRDSSSFPGTRASTAGLTSESSTATETPSKMMNGKTMPTCTA